MQRIAASLILIGSFIFSCSSQNQNPSGNAGSIGSSPDWLIPQTQVFDGGPGKDGIPALENPETSNLQEISFLSDDDLVVGFGWNGEYRAYPHNILDWHEIINDNLNGAKIAVTYCPLTGTGIGWNREISGTETTFGVSGLLYNTNLIPYDRYTDSNWCQISLECINGTLKGSSASTFQVIETTWKTWKSMFPNSSVVNTNTGFSRSYGLYPYGDYRTNNNSLLFPVSPKDERLPAKERILAIIVDDKAKVYRFKEFTSGTQMLLDEFNDRELLVVGNTEMNYIVAYENKLNGLLQEFELITDSGDDSIIFADAKGNKYNIFGQVVEGPNTGLNLTKATSFMAYWFSIGAFYPKASIYDSGN